ncbi:MAG: TonB-dependent receptor, partial [candidate division WOR-3 bacterium]
MRRKLMCMLPVLFATFIFAVSLFAQSAAPLRGQVLDELGAVIPGAHVTLIRADGNQRTTVTDVTGEFTFPNVAPGTYTLIVKFEGFQTYTEKDLSFPLAASPLRITLRVAPLREEIEVSTETQGVSVEPDQNLSAIILDEAFIQTLPDNEEDLRSFLLALAGPSAGGASGGQGEAQIYVDGFPGGRLPPREAIMQIRINQNPFSAEYSYPGMGRIEIITRPGTDQWRGNVGFSFRNSAIDARNAFAQTKPDLDQKRYSFNFSGPLLPKKMSFFANVERRQLHGSGTVRAETLDGPFVANVPAPSANTSFFLRSSYLINQKNTLNIGYSFTTSESKNREFVARFGGFGPPGGFGGGGGGGGNNYTLPERGSNSENTNQTLQLAETFLMSTRLIHETRLRFQREQSASTANTQGVAINVLDAFNGGGSTCCPNESRQNTLEFQDYLTYTYKTHMIKGGFQLQYENNRDLNGSNFNGTYTFSSLDQYRRVLAGEHVDPEDPTSPLVRPTQFTINRGDPLLRYSQYQASWFLQDDWRVRPTLTLSVGLRHEFQAHLDDKVNFAPRLGIAWSPLKDRKTTVRAGGGLFFSRLSGGLYANTLRYDGVTQQSIVIRHPLYPDPFA